MANLFRNRRRDQQRAEARRYERMSQMKAEHWSRVNARGINPYTIDRVDGTYQVEFDRTGRSLPIDDWHDVPVRAYEVRCPDGSTYRVSSLKDARAFIAYSKALAEARVGSVIPAAPAFRRVGG